MLSNRYRTLRDHFYSDMTFSRFKSLAGNTCAQIFCNKDFVWVYPMSTKGDAAEALQVFHEDIGVPTVMVVDGASELSKKNSKFYKRSQNSNTVIKTTEPYTPRQNFAETWIGWLKKRWRNRMRRNNVPPRLWDHGLRYEAEIMIRVARGVNKRTAYERITGETPDISEWLDYDFYDWVYFWDEPSAPENPVIGRWLGVSHRIGSALCYFILKSNGQVVSRTTVQPMKDEELSKNAIQHQLNEFDANLKERLSDSSFQVVIDPSIQYLEDEIAEADVWVPAQGEIPQVEMDTYDPETYDRLLGAEVILSNGDRLERANVTKRLKDSEGNPIGRKHANPILDTSQYEVTFSSGAVREYAANVIAENLIAQCDDEGREFQLLQGIISHHTTSEAMKKGDNIITTSSGQQRHKLTTVGWEMLVEWRDGSSNWVPLKELKESNPVEVAEYAVSCNIHEEPAFVWWVKDVLKWRNRIISKVKSKYWKTTHKFGIKLPHSVKEALEIDKQNGNTLWYDAIMKEMKNVRGAFRNFEGATPEQIRNDPKLLPAFQEIKCHMIFDIKMDFSRKARFVAGGHMTDPPSSITYSSVVSRERVLGSFLCWHLFWI